MPSSNTEPNDIETAIVIVIVIGIDTKYNLVLFVFFNPWELIVWWGTIAFLFRGEIRPFLFTGALGGGEISICMSWFRNRFSKEMVNVVYCIYVKDAIQ